MDERAGERIVIRTLEPRDLDRIVRMDRQIGGRDRRTFFAGKLDRALNASDVAISLGAELDGMLVGALMGAVHYGEFGLAEPVAILDTILVDREFARQGVGAALLEQLVKNLRALRIETLRTEVAWNDHDLVAFLARSGFAPAHRLVLELPLGL